MADSPHAPRHRPQVGALVRTHRAKAVPLLDCGRSVRVGRGAWTSGGPIKGSETRQDGSTADAASGCL